MKTQILILSLLLFFSPVFAQNKLRQLLDGEGGISKHFTMLNDSDKVAFSSSNARSAFGLHPNSGLVLINSEKDKLGFTHYRYHQTYKGIPVENSMYIVHVKAGKLEAMSGEIVTQFDDIANARTTAGITATQAINAAIKLVNAKIYAWQDNDMEQSLKEQKGDRKATYFPAAQLVWFNDGEQIIPGKLHVAWKVDVYAREPLSRAYYFIDAQTGKVLGKKDEIFYSDFTGTANTTYSGTQPIHSDLNGSSYRLRDLTKGGGVITLHGESGKRGSEYTSTSSTWILTGTDQAAMDVHFGVSQTWSFYKASFNRNSYDDKGTALTSYVNDQSYIDNAFWDGTAMNFCKRSTGNPGGVTGIDVAGHELTHAVTQSESGLGHSSEPGAMNESMSDIMGKSVQFYSKPNDVNWQLSNDMSWIIRDMSNPNLLSQPDTYKGLYWQPNTDPGDSYGVHTNCGVGNFMFYLLVKGGSGINDIGNNYAVTGIGLDHADQIIYRTNATYLTPTSQYPDWRTACIQAATDLYGASSNEAAQVQNAWYAVGIGTAAPTPNSADLCNLVLSAGILAPQFASNNKTYTALVGNNITSIAITPTACYPAAIIKITNSGIIVQVPNGSPSPAIPLSTGSNTITIQVISANGLTTNTYTLIVTRLGQHPIISSFAPVSGPAGSIVTIAGSNFNPTPASNIVYFGATRATVTGGTTTSLTVTAPVGATYQPISVLDKASGLTGYSPKPFIITFTNPFGTGIPANYYRTKVDFGIDQSPDCVGTGDIDGDGKPDLVVANSNSGTISILRNTSVPGSITASSLAAGVGFATGHGGSRNYVAIGDLDGDGKPDIVTANYNENTISVLRNTSTSGSINTSSFTGKVDFSVGAYPQSVFIADVDGDGKPDVVVMNNSEFISVFRNISSSGSINPSSFAPKIDFTIGYYPSAIALGDVDGDSKPDLVVLNLYMNTVSVLRNTSTSGINASSFAARIDFNTDIHPYSVAIGDLDGDGKPDIAIANFNYTSSTVSVLRNTSTSGSINASSFASKVDFTIGINPLSIAMGDVDGDGKSDLVIANNGSNTISVLRNNSTSGSINASSFAPKVDFVTANGPYSAVIGDIDGDGIPEVTTANHTSNTISVFKINSPISPTTTPPVVSSFSPTSGAVGTTVTISGANFNATPASNIVYFGAVRATVTGGSTTSLTVKAPAGATYQPVSVLNNVNGLTGYSSKPFITTFANPFGIGIPSNYYKPKVDFATGYNPYAVATADLDGDGKPDMVIANYNSNTVSVLRNISSSGSITASSFAAKVDFSVGLQPTSVAIGDLDGDGKPDIVIANSNSATLSVLRNTSTSGSITASSFAAKVDFATGASPLSIAIGDLDGDGKPDLVTANNGSGTLSVLRNISTTGSITSFSFAPKVDFNAGVQPYAVATGDLDGDGRAELVVANNGANTLSVLRNTSASGSITASSFAAKVDFATGTSPRSLAIGDIDGDGKADLAVANNGAGTLSVLRNTSASGSIAASSFASRVDFGSGANPRSIAIGDADGDGKPDLLTANIGPATVSVLRNISASGSITASSFAAKVDFGTGLQPYSVAIGDLDGDGISEVITANLSSNTVSVLKVSSPVTPTTVVKSDNGLNSIDQNGLVKSNDLKVYPNPSNGRFTVQLFDLAVPAITIHILDQNGKLVEQKTIELTGKTPSLTIPFNLHNPSAGTYFIKVISVAGVKNSKIDLIR